MLLGVLLVSCQAPMVPPPPCLPGELPAETDSPSAPQPSADSDSGVSAAPALPPAPSGRANLLLISLDTLRRDAIGRYRGSSEASPSLDRWMESAVVLDDHRSCSNWTYPSMLCGLSGQGVLELGFIPMTNLGDPVMIPESFRFLGDWLGERGYQTALATANPLIGVKFGFSRSYQTLWESSGATAESVAAKGLDWLQDRQDDEQPWFVHLHFLDPHIAYNPPEAYLGELKEGEDPYTKTLLTAAHEDRESYSEEEWAIIEHNLAVRYGGEVRYMDDTIGQLLDSAEAIGALEDTLVVIFSDHGEQFFEHGEIVHHKGIYEEETGAIAGFSAPWIPAQAWPHPTTHADLVPGIFSALGLEPEAGWSGQTPGSGGQPCARFAHAIDEETGTQSVDHDGWRLVYHWSGELELYSRGSDPADLHDTLAEHPDIAASLWALLEPTTRELDALHPQASPKEPSW